MRIQKFLAQLGYGSRRKIEEMIENKEITINGREACLGEKVDGNENIYIQNEKVKCIIPITRVLVYYKPNGEICSKVDNEAKGTCFDRLPKLKTGKWQNVGRLDAATSGLLLFTTSGELSAYLAHPKNQFLRTYWIKAKGLIEKEKLIELVHGVELEDGEAKILKFRNLKYSQDTTQLEVTVDEGRNRLIRRLISKIGYEIIKLKRLSYGPFSLSSKMSPGHFIEVDEKTVIYLLQKMKTKKLT